MVQSEVPLLGPKVRLTAYLRSDGLRVLGGSIWDSTRGGTLRAHHPLRPILHVYRGYTIEGRIPVLDQGGLRTPGIPSDH